MEISPALSEQFAALLSAQVRRGMDAKARSGWLPGRAPVGYKNITRGGQKLIVVDDEKAPLIRAAFELVGEKHVLPSVVLKQLRKQAPASGAGGFVGMAVFYSLLTNPFYMGLIRYHGELIPGEHQPIVSPELFEAVQARLEKLTSARSLRLRMHFGEACDNVDQSGAAQSRTGDRHCDAAARPGKRRDTAATE